MVDEDVQIVGIDERMLRRGVEKIPRVPHDELIDRRARRHHHRRRRAGAAAGTARALPRRGDRARIAGEHADVEGADIDAEFERVGRDDAAYLRRRAARVSISRRRSGR